MYEVPKSPPENPEKSAVPAVTRAHDMLIGLCGQRGWNDTRESWLARGARKARLSLRRARSIFYQEPIRLTADEYVAIQEAYEAAYASLAAVSDLARDANLRVVPAPIGRAEIEALQGRPDHREQQPRAVPAVRSAGG